MSRRGPWRVPSPAPRGPPGGLLTPVSGCLRLRAGLGSLRPPGARGSWLDGSRLFVSATTPLDPAPAATAKTSTPSPQPGSKPGPTPRGPALRSPAAPRPPSESVPLPGPPPAGAARPGAPSSEWASVFDIIASASAKRPPPASRRPSGFVYTGLREALPHGTAPTPPLALPQAEPEAEESDPDATAGPDRGHPILAQLVNNIMRDGKKTVAQGLVNQALLHISTRTRADPTELLVSVIGRVSPLVKSVTYKVGGKAKGVPVPLNDRQSRRQGIVWLLKAAKERQGVGFGKALGQECLAVLNGKSPALQARAQAHALGLANRSNIILKDMPMRRR